jgi:hypothetical protein
MKIGGGDPGIRRGAAVVAEERLASFAGAL